MGYYTTYNLYVENGNDVDFSKELYDMDEALWVNYGDVTHYCTDEPAKWYDWEEDMIELSKKYPEVLFELHGDGEEDNDRWKAWFKNGKTHTVRARLVWDEFDPKKLDE